MIAEGDEDRCSAGRCENVCKHFGVAHAAVADVANGRILARGDVVSSKSNVVSSL